MGINIYLTWKGQTRMEKRFQHAAAMAMSRNAGHVGYLREAYAGEPALHFYYGGDPDVEVRDLTNIPPPTKDQFGPLNMVNGESTHTLPYATKHLAYEVFNDPYDPKVRIPAELLVERLPEAIKIHIEKEKTLYDRTLTQESRSVKSYIEFVALVSKLELLGKNPEVIGDY